MLLGHEYNLEDIERDVAKMPLGDTSCMPRLLYYAAKKKQLILPNYRNATVASAPLEASKYELLAVAELPLELNSDLLGRPSDLQLQ